MLRHEWLNARGAIARFDRNAIEIRLADTQECPRADVAVAHAICAVVKMLYDAHDGHDVATGALARLLRLAIRDGEDAIAGEDYLHALGIGGAGPCPMRDAWRRALDRAGGEGPWRETVDVILSVARSPRESSRRPAPILPGIAFARSTASSPDAWRKTGFSPDYRVAEPGSFCMRWRSASVSAGVTCAAATWSLLRRPAMTCDSPFCMARIRPWRTSAGSSFSD